MVDVTDTDAKDIYGTLTDDGGAATAREARDGLRHMLSLSMTKVSDGLISPKLVLAWIMQSIGAPAALVGLLVPIREAGALLPQVLLAGPVEAMRHRKWIWVAGSLGQGVSAAGIALVAMTLQGWVGGIAICGLLALLAVSRAACSVSYKDILGKTVKKTRRGAVKGVAGSASSAAVLIFALLLLSGLMRDITPLAIAVGIAAVLWIVAAAIFARLEEQPSEPGEGGGLDFSPLREDAQFRRFIAARGFLTATALAPPYLVLLDDGGGALQKLGALLLASAAAAFVSSYIWGRMSDRSSRRVLILAGLSGAAAMIVAVVAALFGVTSNLWVTPAILFALQIAYQGVRSGRSTYLVDMAPEDQRASYAALANTAIGILLLAAGALGGVLATLSPETALAGFAVLSILGAITAIGLDEVEALQD
ncbi:Major Facilitator Superfamily protein [Roseivivax lentus]|uniref:Major Facilitator Superfamily protein n=1 Tax=Roseivivax lentus TaxID=633194 RepID=A0A1N7L3B6_9RHOB|nr:MFS transporter [Roseivivax lentus]SIS68160.1 Major Facilitator Superfamily protein [Roseivivax lentus]